MSKEVNVTEGNITKGLTKLALPLMGTSFIGMAYNFTDLYWVGKISTEAVAAVGICGLFWWFVSGLVLICNIGLAVTVSQSYGRNDYSGVKKYINAGVKLNVFIALVSTVIVYIFHRQLLSFFNIQDELTLKYSVEYLKVVSLGFLINFMNPILSAIMNATGNSSTPFKISSISLVANMILDPLFIVYLDMGVEGSAIATVLALLIGFFLFIIEGKHRGYIYCEVDYRERCELKRVKEVLYLGFPPAIQSIVHCMINMYISKIVNSFGSAAVAAQSIGSQIESISWMTAEGFATANSTFIGQNYGAKKYDRVKKVYSVSVRLMFVIGLCATAILFFGRRQLISIFLHEEEAINHGMMYLMVLSFSQALMMVEIATSGAFNGISLTRVPSIIGTVGNIIRIPMAYLLMKPFGLTGVWIAITISSILKGVVTIIWFQIAQRSKLNECSV